MDLVIEALSGRSSRTKAGLLLGSALFAAGVSTAWADPVEALQGAWVMEISDCAGVFEKSQGQIRFKDRTYANDSGFIISGSKGKGEMGGSCTISQVDDQKDHFSALLSCSDGLVSRKFSGSFRIIDATHFERIDPEYPGSPIRYKKCVF